MFEKLRRFLWKLKIMWNQKNPRKVKILRCLNLGYSNWMKRIDGGIKVHRICNNCNQEYLVLLRVFGPENRYGVNHTDCPLCGKRDDIWITLTVEDDED